MRYLLLALVFLILTACGKEATTPSVSGLWSRTDGEGTVDFRDDGNVWLAFKDATGTLGAPIPWFSYKQEGATLRKYHDANDTPCRLVFQSDSKVVISCPDEANPTELQK